MELQKVEMQVPKDFVEVVDLVDAIIEKVQAKASMAEYLGLIEKLSAAADGIGNVKKAVSGQYRDECSAYLVKKLMERLAPGTDEAPATDAAPEAE